jgi:hypothetical protein
MVFQKEDGSYQWSITTSNEELKEAIEEIAEEMGWSMSQATQELAEVGIENDPRVQHIVNTDDSDDSGN